MEYAELLEKISAWRLKIVPKFLARNPAAGAWNSPFEGSGFDFSSMRDFVPGDNPKRIHYPTSAKRGVLTVVERIELRDFTIMVYVDCSGSMRLRGKPAIARNISALLLFGAFKMESSFGLGTLNDYTPIVRPRTGPKQFSLVYDTLWEYFFEERASLRAREEAILDAFLEHLQDSNIPKKSILFLVSDFLGACAPRPEDEKILRALADRYDIIAVIVQDDLEYDFPVFPHAVAYPFRDAETGEEGEVWPSMGQQRDLALAHRERFKELNALFRRCDIRYLHPKTDDVPTLFNKCDQFFSQR